MGPDVHNHQVAEVNDEYDHPAAHGEFEGAFTRPRFCKSLDDRGAIQKPFFCGEPAARLLNHPCIDGL